MSDAGTKRAIAGLATVGGVVLVIAFAMQVSNQDAEDADLGWYGEQWDVARHCVVGTPLGRGESEEEIARRVVREAYRAAAALEGGADPEHEWPWSCSARLAALRDAPALPASPVPALAELELRLGRVLAPPISVPTITREAENVAARVAQLDAAMPPGGTYDARRFAQAPLAAPAELITRTHAVEPPPVILRRPFLGARVGGERLHDERVVDGVSERLLGEAGSLRVARSDGDERPLQREGLRLPRFFDSTHLGWITTDERASVVLEVLATGERAPARVFGVAAPDRWAVVDGALLFGRADAVWLARWTAASEATPLEPPPPNEGVVWAASASTVVLLWPIGEGWVGHRCAPDCAPLPRLLAGGDAQVAVVNDIVFVLARSRTTPLTFGHRLPPEAEAWEPPIPMPAGTLTSVPERFVVGTASVELWSWTGERWAVPTE